MPISARAPPVALLPLLGQFCDGLWAVRKVRCHRVGLWKAVRKLKAGTGKEFLKRLLLFFFAGACKIAAAGRLKLSSASRPSLASPMSRFAQDDKF